MNDVCPTPWLRSLCSSCVSEIHFLCVWPALIPLRPSALALLPGRFQIVHVVYTHCWLIFFPAKGSACCILAPSNPNPLAPTRHLLIFWVSKLIIHPGTSSGKGNSLVCSGGNLSCSRCMGWIQLWVLPDGYLVVPALLIECRHENQSGTVRGAQGPRRSVGRAGAPAHTCSMLALDVSDEGRNGCSKPYLLSLFVGLLSIYVRILSS